jgi:hypothetical protein
MINGRKTIADSFDGCIPDDSDLLDVYLAKCLKLGEERDIYKRALELACEKMRKLWTIPGGNYIRAILGSDIESEKTIPKYWIELAKQELEQDD